MQILRVAASNQAGFLQGTTRANNNPSRGKVKHYYAGSNSASLEGINLDTAS